MCQKVRHDVKKYIMMSNNTPWHYKVCMISKSMYDVKKYVISIQKYQKKIMENTSSNCHKNKNIMTSKIMSYSQKLFWHQSDISTMFHSRVINNYVFNKWAFKSRMLTFHAFSIADDWYIKSYIDRAQHILCIKFPTIFITEVAFDTYIYLARWPYIIYNIFNDKSV